MNRRAAQVVVLVGAVYLFTGIISATFSKNAVSHEMVLAWRWAAWLVSAIAFGAHIVYEQAWIRSSRGVAAFRVALGAALAGCGLAVAANIHALADPAKQPSTMLVWSVVIWPVMIALPAFVVALAAGVILARARRMS